MNETHISFKQEKKITSSHDDLMNDNNKKSFDSNDTNLDDNNSHNHHAESSDDDDKLLMDKLDDDSDGEYSKTEEEMKPTKNQSNLKTNCSATMKDLNASTSVRKKEKAKWTTAEVRIRTHTLTSHI
jgi:hypothetical protein